jgi:nucleotide-binding universal stress UspA family protein
MKAKPTKNEGEILLQVSRSDEDLLEAACCPTRGPAFKIKQVLVPVDFSECSKKALQYAVALAREHKASIALLYVVPTNYAVGEFGDINYTSIEEDERSRAERELAALAVDEVRGVVAADTLIRNGSPATAIIDVAKKLPADVIVIATHGRTGLTHALLGSVAEHVVRKAPCPVLVVREREREILAD